MTTTPPGTDTPAPPDAAYDAVRLRLAALSAGEARRALLQIYATLYPRGAEATEWTSDTIENVNDEITRLLDNRSRALLLTAITHHATTT